MKRNRIKLLKRIIIYAILSAIILPAVLCVALSVKLAGTRRQIRDLEERLLFAEESLRSGAAAEPGALENIETSIFVTAKLEESGRGGVLKTEELSERTAERKVYLTFDDGPSSNTERILDILQQYEVKATFFVVGRTDERSLAAYRRIVAEGHTLGMHSYSHRYQDIYRSAEAFSADLKRLQELLYDETGVWCRIYRFPGGSSNNVSNIDMQELIEFLDGQDIAWFDWNISSGDAASGMSGARRIVNNCLTGLNTLKAQGENNDGIILLHDSAAKNSTVEALPEIISGILASENTVLLPLSDDTLPVQHITYRQNDEER